jgi:polar amino acid transport system substrate-binding protein
LRLANNMFRLCIVLALLSVFSVAATQRISVAIDHAPPYSYAQGEERPRGLLIDILKRVSKEVDFSLQIIPCPFSRCLRMLKDNKVDIMGGLIRTKERENELAFFEPAYMVLNSSFVFYGLHNKNIQLENYEDLYEKRVAVMRGGVYFERFDKDKRLTKVQVPSEQVAMDLLLKDRVDVVVAVEATADHALDVLNQPSYKLRKLAYRHTEQILGHMAASKKFAKDPLYEKIQNKVKELYFSGELDYIVARYSLPPIPSPFTKPSY